MLDLIDEECFDDDALMSLVDDEIDDLDDAEDDLLNDGGGDSDAIDIVMGDGEETAENISNDLDIDDLVNGGME